MWNQSRVWLHARVCKIGEVRVVRKDRVKPGTNKSMWWYVVHAKESVLSDLETKWDQANVQTGWKLELCFMAESTQISSSKELCCICCQPVSIGKDEALFCAGACQKWLHRYCASVSERCYKAISESSTPFFCLGCYQEHQQEHITELTNTVEDLRLEIARLKESLSAAQAEAKAKSDPLLGLFSASDIVTLGVLVASEAEAIGGSICDDKSSLVTFETGCCSVSASTRGDGELTFFFGGIAQLRDVDWLICYLG